MCVTSFKREQTVAFFSEVAAAAALFIQIAVLTVRDAQDGFSHLHSLFRSQRCYGRFSFGRQKMAMNRGKCLKHFHSY